MGLLLCIVVHTANIQERAGARLVLEKASGHGLSRMEKILADDGYPETSRWAHEVRILLEEDFPNAKKVILVCNGNSTPKRQE